MDSFDVIIAGCGPTGAALANYLGKNGLTVLIIDREDAIVDYPRAVHIDEEVIRIFQELQVYEQMKTTAIKEFEYYQLVNPRDKVLFEFKPNCSISQEIPSCNWILQPEIERYLREGFSRYPNVLFRNNTECTGFSQDERNVNVNLRDVNTGIEYECKAKYLVAADGGRSNIRKQLNIAMLDFGFRKEWFVVDTEYKGTDSYSEKHKQYCDPKRPTTYVNGVGNHFRWEFMIKDTDAMLSETEFERECLQSLASKVPVADFELIRKKKYCFHTVIAKKWRVKRVFLAGDAAHQMPPFLGQGMCSGIKDVRNLAWKLEVACKVNNAYSELLLDSYFDERFLQVKRIIKMASYLGSFIQYTNQYLTPIRNLVLKAINILPQDFPDQLIERYLYSYRHSTRSIFPEFRLSGTRLPQPMVQYNGERVYLDKILKEEWTILTNKIDITKNDIYGANIIFVSDKLIGADHIIVSPELVAWFKKKKTDFVIVRPDKTIYGAGTAHNLEIQLKELSALLNAVYYRKRLHRAEILHQENPSDGSAEN